MQIKLLLFCFLIFSGSPFGWSRTIFNRVNFPDNFFKFEEGLTKDDIKEIKVGFSLFASPWVQAPSSTKRRDGLGPHFQAQSCIACHPGFGRNINAKVFIPIGPELIQKYGNQITSMSIPEVKSEPHINAVESKLFEYVHYGLKEKPLAVSPRVAPHLAGLGYLEKIPSEEIIKNSLKGGKPSFKDGRVLRFGWKASQLNLTQQVAKAFSHDLGITNYLYPKEQCVKDDLACLNSINGNDEEGVEIREDHLKMVVKLIKNIRPPMPLKENKDGLAVFKKVSCHQCHRPMYEVEGENIYPYTDLLLHDMGSALADYGKDPQRRYWRTPPLWGLGSQKIVNGHMNLLHDGRAKGIEEAILWHGGEAEIVIEKYKQLPSSDKESLLDFLSYL